MSLFDELANLWLKVLPSADTEPRQWIYAVDDAWFHPEAAKVNISERIMANGQETARLVECESVFPFDLVGKTAAANDSALSSLRERGDAAIAARILRFIGDQFTKEGLRYGVCFCSFEHLWKNIACIDLPENAVLFDIRHALGWDGSTMTRTGENLDLRPLRQEWSDVLTSANLFQNVSAHMERLGWYLHYCLKFGKVPNQVGPRCFIHSNHIQILSSAVNPGAGRSEALSDYSQVQEFIWGKLSSLGAAQIEEITPEYFTFSPMPKNAAMDTGLAIFNNSFKHAANWGRIKMCFLEDVAMVYEHPQVTNGHFNNGDVANQASWKWKSWMPLEKRNVSNPLYKTYDEPWIRINDLLRMLSHSGVREFPRQLDRYDDKQVLLPTTPGFAFVILLIEFINNLAPKEGRQPPVVEYELEEGNGAPRFHVKVTLANSGAQELWSCYTTGKKPNGDSCGTASKVLRALGAQRSTEASVYEIHEKKTVTSHLPAGITVIPHEDYPVIQAPSNGQIIITLRAS